jgi:hypothetical protein
MGLPIPLRAWVAPASCRLGSETERCRQDAGATWYDHVWVYPRYFAEIAQLAGRTRDRCETEKERVRKSVKTRGDECTELMARGSERQGAEDRGGVRTDPSA